MFSLPRGIQNSRQVCFSEQIFHRKQSLGTADMHLVTFLRYLFLIAKKLSVTIMILTHKNSIKEKKTVLRTTFILLGPSCLIAG